MDDVDWMAMDDEDSKQIRSEPPAACDDWSWSTEKKEEPLQGDKQQCLGKMFQENPGANRPVADGSMAWADWANPRVADPAPSLGDRPRKASRLSASQKTALEKSAAAAHALAKKAADESEIACRRLAANAAKQKEETKVRQAGHPEKLDDNLTKDEKKPKDDVSSEKKPGNDVSSEKKPGDAVSSTPMPTGQSGGGKPVADAEKKGLQGTQWAPLLATGHLQIQRCWSCSISRRSSMASQGMRLKRCFQVARLLLAVLCLKRSTTTSC